MNRKCGECQLCCKLLPMVVKENDRSQETVKLMLQHGMIKEIPPMLPDFDKPSGHRCPHQKHGLGCRVYNKRPFGCRMWICAWLQGADLPRPDHCHYVVDVVPDEIMAGDNLIPVIQVWCDRGYPDAHRDPRLRAIIEQQGMAALIRYNEADGFVLFPPSLTGAGWVEHRNTIVEKNPTFGITARLKQMERLT